MGQVVKREAHPHTAWSTGRESFRPDWDFAERRWRTPLASARPLEPGGRFERAAGAYRPVEAV